MLDQVIRNLTCPNACTHLLGMQLYLQAVASLTVQRHVRTNTVPVHYQTEMVNPWLIQGYLWTLAHAPFI